MTTVGIDLLAHCATLERMVTAWDLRRFAAGTERMMDRGFYFDFEDRLVLEDLPHLRDGTGGVFFFGTSAMKWATRMWDEPDSVRARVHNFGIGATNHAMQLQFARHLVEQEGLLAAGPDRVHAVLGLYWSMSVGWDPEAFFGPLWRRHGLYTYDREQGIATVPVGGIERLWLRERGRCAGFLTGGFNRVARAAATSVGFALSDTENIQDRAKVAAWAERMAGSARYADTLDKQMTALADLVAYLRSQGVGVTAVLLPQRHAYGDLPWPIAYRERVLDLARTVDLQVIDLSGLLAEAEFADMNHSNDAGLTKTHRALMDLAAQRLAEMGMDTGARGSGGPAVP